ncbi:MAG: hypothetical protein IJ699_08330, partial [Bacteroidaceae bacterium]|nr:hypothetical protein [Bacteroidaceae bacterium]
VRWSCDEKRGGICWCKGTAFIWNSQTFSKKRINLAEEIVILPQSAISHFLLLHFFVPFNFGSTAFSLYGKIVRMQQIAILQGLGDEEWSHMIIESPGERLTFINSIYRKKDDG